MDILTLLKGLNWIAGIKELLKVILYTVIYTVFVVIIDQWNVIFKIKKE